MTLLFGVIIPYLALFLFAGGVVLRVVGWARSPVPFRIPVTGGQQQSLSWIKQAKLDNPGTTLGVIGRMLLEILFFRSLVRNTRGELRQSETGPKLAYHWEKWLWLGALAFHWSLFVVLIRHLRFFVYPVPGFVRGLESLDGLFRIGLPVLYVTDVLFVAGLTYLFIRRVVIPQVRYISLPVDYVLPLLLLSIAGTGILMRYFYKVDVISIKDLGLGLATFSPKVPEGIGLLFYLHLTLVSGLVAYLPWSKLIHMAAVFMTPTRNQANNSRIVRHMNPWNAPSEVHTYAHYEDEFREKMRSAGLPLEKEGA